MSNYYEKRDAKVRIAHELMARGWKVHGYKPDQSDSMTDYYDPANWDGIAEKNGFILVIDHDRAEESKPIEKYNPKGNLSFEDREKITKLEMITQANGATAGEEENAKALIQKIKEKVISEPAFEIVGYTVAHMANPKGSIWHIEKDGKIYDKGRALTKFADVPDSSRFDFEKMQYKESYKHWGEISEEQRKIINEFMALILRFERVVNGMYSMGDGTAETEKAGLEQQAKAGYEKKIIKETKKILKMVEVADRKTVKTGDYLSFNYHCGYWLITEISERLGTWKVNGIPTQVTKNAVYYESVGKESRGFKRLNNAKKYYQWEDSLLKGIEKGTCKIFELKEVEETIEKEKWVKIDRTQKTYNNKPETKHEEKKVAEMEQKKEQVKMAEQSKTKQPKTENENPNININNDTGNIELVFTNPLNIGLELKNTLRFNGFMFNSMTKNWEIKNTEKNMQKVSTIFGITAEKEQPKTQRNKVAEIAEQIIDKSTDIITELQLTPEQYATSEDYKAALKTYIEKQNIKIKAEILDYIRKQELYKLAEVLEYFNIKDGFIYDCHFKAWDMSIDEIKTAVTALNISFVDYGNKIGFIGLTAEQTRQVKEISDKNNSIFFIDKEEKETKKYPAELTINKQLNGIELKFITEPDEQCKAELIKSGFRYSQFKKIWYSVYTISRLQKACEITGTTMEHYEEAI